MCHYGRDFVIFDVETVRILFLVQLKCSLEKEFHGDERFYQCNVVDAHSFFRRSNVASNTKADANPYRYKKRSLLTEKKDKERYE